MGGASSQGGHGRRARREQAAPGPPRDLGPVGHVVGWVLFTVAVTAGVLLVAGLSALTVLALVGAAALVGAVLVLAVALSPPLGAPDAARPAPDPGRPDVTRGDTGGS